METQLLTQPKTFSGKDYTLGEHIRQLLTSKRPKYTEISFYFGLVKENAYEKLYETFKEFIINGGDINFYLSPEKKGSTKKVVNSLLELGCNVYLFTGAEKDYIPDFQYKNIIATSSKKVVVLLSSGNFSLSGLYEGHNIITEFLYNLTSDKEEYCNFSKSFLPKYTSDLFKKITRENFDDFFAPQDKSIASIEEFTKKDLHSTSKISTSVDDLSIDIEIDKNVDFLVPTEPVEKIKKEKKSEAVQSAKTSTAEPVDAIEFEGTKYYMDNDALDIENMLFSTSTKIPEKSKPISKKANNVVTPAVEEDIPEENPAETKIITKSANLSQTSIFMFQLPKITKKGASAGEIKIPLYLRDLIPLFWGWPKEYKIAKNSVEKLRICRFNIIDTKKPDITLTDEKVKLFQREGENAFVVLSEELIKMDLAENDIVRFIKTQSKDGTYYTCEIIRQDAKEYPIWEQFCTNLLKGSKRKYGIM